MPIEKKENTQATKEELLELALEIAIHHIANSCAGGCPLFTFCNGKCEEELYDYFFENAKRWLQRN